MRKGERCEGRTRLCLKGNFKISEIFLKEEVSQPESSSMLNPSQAPLQQAVMRGQTASWAKVRSRKRRAGSQRRRRRKEEEVSGELN